MFVQPMLCKAMKGATLPAEGYIFEPKWDGIRAIIHIGSSVKIYTRQGREVTPQFPEIVSSFNLQAFRRQITFDAEIVVFKDGVPSFPHVTSRLHLGDDLGRAIGAQDNPARAVVFDVVRFDNEDITHRKLEHRRTMMRDLTLDQHIMLSPIRVDGEDLMEEMSHLSMEGVVAKKIGSPYRPGKRTRDWLKFKLMYEEIVEVYGYTEGLGKRDGFFGALLIRDLDGEDIGKVGTGFTDEVLAMMTQKLNYAGAYYARKDEHHVIKPFKIVVKGMKKNLSGAIREPRFICVHNPIKISSQE